MHNIQNNFDRTRTTTCSKEQVLNHVDLTSLCVFFIDVLDYLLTMKPSQVITSREIVVGVIDVSHKHSDNLEPYVELLDLIADLGWLNLEHLGVNFDDEIIYQVKH
jgi:hypothetical protein